MAFTTTGILWLWFTSFSFLWKKIFVFIHWMQCSARISKGQGYQGFLRKRAGSSFGQKRAICIVQGKT
jgi:hypothetical protein